MIKVLCAVCNKIIDAKNKNRKYCSDACNHKSHRNKRLQNEECVVCGRKVEETNPFTGKKFTECVEHRERHENRIIICVECGNTFVAEHYHFRKFCCKKCKNRFDSRRYRSTNKEIKNKKDLDYYYRHRRIVIQELRIKFLDIYGHQCALCGHSDPEVLTLDHINGGGGQERKLKSQGKILREAINEYNPNKYRVLCMNCNWKLRFSNKKGVKNE